MCGESGDWGWDRHCDTVPAQGSAAGPEPSGGVLPDRNAGRRQNPSMNSDFRGVRRASLARTAVVAVLLFAIVLPGAPGCRPSEEPLRVGANVWPGYDLMFLARELGYYDEQTIRLIDFSSAAEVSRAYRNRLLDVAALTADEALAVTSGQTDHRIVLVFDFSNGADVLLSRPEIRSIEDLRGRRVGVETTALGAYMLARALEGGGLSPRDVTVVEVPLSRHEKAFAAGEVDAVVTFEPIRSRLLASGARKLFDSSQIRGEIVDVLLTRLELPEGKRRALAALVSGWFRALDYLEKHPADAAARIAPREGVTAEQFLASLGGLQLADRQANLRLLGRASDNLEATLSRLSAVMLGHGIAADTIETPLLDDALVRTAKR